MAKFIIKGGLPLSGRVTVSGNKNSVLKLMAAAALAESPTKLTNVPDILDVDIMGEIMQGLGIKVTGLGTSELEIDPKGLSEFVIKRELSGRVRTAPLLIAPLLLKFGKAQISTPGGCSLGRRLLHTHFNMLEAMGAKISRKENSFLIKWKPGSKNRDVFLEEASVTATELGLLLAAASYGKTTISDAACEPHVVDLAEMLGKMGAKIEGIGTSTLEVAGKKKLLGVKHQVIPDHIEAGSWAIAAAVTGGNVQINNVRKKDLQMICAYFDHLGLKYSFLDDKTWKIYPSKLKFDKKIREFQTRPWPGFPTDLMSPLIVLATQTEGQMLCHDWMYEWRIFFVDDLISMGAKVIIADPHRIVVSGPSRLQANNLVCKDIRAGIAIVIAALAARGVSEIEKIEKIERGYEKLESKLRSLGANVKRA